MIYHREEDSFVVSVSVTFEFKELIIDKKL